MTTTTFLDKETMKTYKKHSGVIHDIDGTARSPYRYSSVRLPYRYSSSGYPGVTRRAKGRYEAALIINNKRESIGLFTTPQLANTALLSALRTMRKGVVK